MIGRGGRRDVRLIRKIEDRPRSVATRRTFLRQAGGGFGAIAAAWLIERRACLPPGGRGRSDSRHGLRTSRPRRRGSSTCSCTAGRATSRPSTPSPISSDSAGQPLPASFGAVATRRQVGGQPAAGHPADVPQVRPERHADLRLPAASRRVRRRAGGDPLVLGRQRQPPAGRLPDEHRLDPDGQAEPGELGRLRPGDREPGPARVRRAARPGRRDQGRAAGLRRRLPAGEPPGDRHAVGLAADPRPGAARGDVRTPPSAGCST